MQNKHIIAFGTAFVCTAIVLTLFWQSLTFIFSHWQSSAACVQCIGKFTNYFFYTNHLIAVGITLFTSMGIFRILKLCWSEIVFYSRTRGKRTRKNIEIVDQKNATAWSNGLWSPRIFIGKSFWKKLSTAERAAVIAHETSHVQHRDMLHFFLLAWSKAILPLPVFSSIIRDIMTVARTQSEHLADQAAIAATSRSVLAQLLQKALLFQAQQNHTMSPRIDDVLKKRIRCITMQQCEVQYYSLQKSYLLTVLLFGLMIATLFWASLEAMHMCMV